MSHPKFNFHLVLLALATILLIAFWGCENPTEVTSSYQVEPGNAQMIGTIHGVVRDAVSTAPIADAQVRYVRGGSVKTATTNSQGYYAIDNLEIGTYDLEISAGDTIHAGASQQVTVSFLAGPDAMVYLGNATYHLYFVADVNLYPLTAGLTGTVYATLDEENAVPAQGAVVEADFTDWMVQPAIYTATADSAGAFTFTNLPASPNVDVRVLPFTYDDMDFGVAVVNNVGLQPSATTPMMAIYLVIAAPMPVVLTNNFAAGNVELDQDLILTFSMAMNPEEMEVELWGSSGLIPCAVSWDSLYITLTIDPTLLLIPDYDYDLYVMGEAMNGAYFWEHFEFSTIDGIEVVESNIYEYDGIPRDNFGLDEAVTVSFSLAADPSHPDNIFQLSQYYAPSWYDVYCDISWNEENTMVTLTPVEPLIPDTDYRLYVDVYSTMPYDHDTYEGYFSTISEVPLPPVPSGFLLEDAEDVNWNTTSLTFTWDTDEDADQYCIWARNDAGAVTWLRLQTVGSAYPSPQQSTTVSLPALYDYLLGDGMLTPFSNGIEMNFQISAVNANGESDPSAPIIAEDVVAPNPIDIGLSQDGSALNLNPTEPDTFYISFTNQTEYCDGASTPIYGFIEAGGDPGFTLDESAAVWSWNVNLRSGYWTVEVPPDQDGSDDLFYMTGVKDNSGNMSTADTTWITLY